MQRVGTCQTCTRRTLSQKSRDERSVVAAKCRLRPARKSSTVHSWMLKKESGLSDVPCVLPCVWRHCRSSGWLKTKASKSA